MRGNSSSTGKPPVTDGWSSRRVGASTPQRSDVDPAASDAAPTSRTGADDAAPLRLVGSGVVPRQPIGAPIERATDPRWVLALRVAEAMEGPILQPQRRERLIRLGQMLGLTAFDCNLVIAIIQDQARRGVSPAVCPRHGLAQLSMVPPARVRDAQQSSLSRRRAWLFALTLVGLVTLELLLIFGWIG